MQTATSRRSARLILLSWLSKPRTLLLKLLLLTLILSPETWGQAASRPSLETNPPVVAIAFSPDGDRLLSASQAGLAAYRWPDCQRLWSTPLRGQTPHDIAFCPSGDLVAIGGGIPGEEGTVEVLRWPVPYDPLTGVAQPERLPVIDQPFDSVMDVEWLNEQHIAAASLDGEVFLFSVETGKQLQRLVGHSRGVRGIAVLPDRQTLVSGSIDHSLRVWDLSSGQLIRSLDQHTRPIVAVKARPPDAAASQTGLPMVASASKDRTIRFWQPTIGRMVRFVRLESIPLDIAWSPDGARIYAACTDGRIRSVDPTTVEVEQTEDIGEQWGYCIAAHPSDGSLAVGGSDGKIDRVILDTPR